MNMMPSSLGMRKITYVNPTILLLPLVLLLSATKICYGFSCVHRDFAGNPVAFASRKTLLSMSVEFASVESLDGDHEAEGSRLSASIAAWLDQEVRGK